MIIIAFLGNPDKKYIRTRHNIGFIAGRYLASKEGISINKKTFSSETGTGKIQGRDTLLMFPQTYMNSSGSAVQKGLKFYNTPPTSLIVVHDDLELSFGQIKTKYSGGHKGHNGIRSIMTETGSADFHRIRFGIGRPENPDISVSDHVLSNFTAEEMKALEELLPESARIIETLLDTIE
jgi:PTH1 family peptidyl-tRNA hydrolase